MKIFILMCATAAAAAAGEGMWPYNQFPKDAVKEKLEFDVPDALLDKLRTSSLKIGGGSGAFVSAEGLLVTNQHLVAGCLGERAEAGFLAATREMEVKCAGLEASALVKIEDVTARVKAAATEGTPAAEALAKRQAAIAALEKECGKGGNSCTVVKFFSGGRYDLYEFKRYGDLRLVFAPEQQLAFFGRERDSITYLRYGIDVAFLRAYEDGRPAATRNFLKWSAEGVKDGMTVFAAGNPAPTVRTTTAAQLTFYRDRSLPLVLGRLWPRIRQFKKFAAENAENARLAEPMLKPLLETYKSAAGKLIGLRDGRLLARKTFFDSRVRRAVEADPKLGTEGGKVWDEIAAAYKKWSYYERPYQVLEEAPAPGSQLYRAARAIVRGQPLDEAALAPVNEKLEALLLSQYIEELRLVGDKDAPIKGVVGSKAADVAAEALVKATALKDPAERKRLAAAGAVAKSTDPMIQLVLKLEPAAQKLRAKREELIGSLEVTSAEKFAQYRFQLFGASDYPDGTSTPRAEFGVVKSYVDRANVPQASASTFSGLYYRRQNEGPYQLPKRWIDAKDVLSIGTPLDFVSTCDIGGGDAGSATVNQAGELVGVTFDGNIESLSSTYLYDEERARAVHVSVQGIAEALDKVYHATTLLAELGVPPTKETK